jgi:hypothetical protein
MRQARALSSKETVPVVSPPLLVKFVTFADIQGLPKTARVKARWGAYYSPYQEETHYAGCAVILRTASDNITPVTPLMIMLTPTSVPIAQAELDGQWI